MLSCCTRHSDSISKGNIVARNTQTKMLKYSLLTLAELVLPIILAVLLVTDGRCSTDSDLSHLGQLDLHEYMHVLETSVSADSPSGVSRRVSDDLRHIPEQLINISRRHVEGSFACPDEQNDQDQEQINILSQGYLHNLAVCPFRYVQNKDCNRKPAALYEVECLCPHRTLGPAHIVCRPVARYVYVFRKTADDNGDFRYRTVWEPLTTACVSLVIPLAPHQGHHQSG